MLDDDDVTPYHIPIGASQSSGPAADIYTSAPTAKLNSSLPPRLPTSSAAGSAMPASAVTGRARASKAVSRQQHVSLEVPSLSHQPSVGSLGRMDSHGSGPSRLGDPLGSQVSSDNDAFPFQPFCCLGVVLASDCYVLCWV